MLLGQNDNDTLQGGAGNDTLSGGDGQDDLDGNAQPPEAQTVVRADSDGNFNISTGNGGTLKVAGSTGGLVVTAGSTTEWVGTLGTSVSGGQDAFVVFTTGAGAFRFNPTAAPSDHDVIVGNQGGDTFHKTDSSGEIQDLNSIDKTV